MVVIKLEVGGKPFPTTIVLGNSVSRIHPLPFVFVIVIS